jgi:opacity protein-like surface antigen
MKKFLWAVLMTGMVFNVRAEEAAVKTEKPAVAETTKSANPSAGLFVGVTAGGDIEESEAAYGAQVQVPFSEAFFAELSVSVISDSYESDEGTVEAELDSQSIGISIGAKAKTAKNCTIYGLFGPNFNMTDIDLDVNQTLVPGASADADVDDEIGFHVAAGSTYQLSQNLSFFIEYRYTFLDLDLEATAIRADGSSEDIAGEGSFDFGVAKAGLNYLF